MDEFINVYSCKTGLKHRVPAHFMDHPVLSKPWRKTPKTRDAGTTSATPGTDVMDPTPDTNDTPAAGDKEN